MLPQITILFMTEELEPFHILHRNKISPVPIYLLVQLRKTCLLSRVSSASCVPSDVLRIFFYCYSLSTTKRFMRSGACLRNVDLTTNIINAFRLPLEGADKLGHWNTERSKKFHYHWVLLLSTTSCPKSLDYRTWSELANMICACYNLQKLYSCHFSEFLNTVSSLSQHLT